MSSFINWFYGKMSKRIKLDRLDDSEFSGTSAGPGGDMGSLLANSIGFEDMPIEMIYRIFEEMSSLDVVKLKGGSQLINSAVRLYIRHSMTGLRISGNAVLTRLIKRLKTVPLNSEQCRFELVNGIYFIRYVLTEVELLFATVWRFRDDDESWNELVTHLAPVIVEFERAISSHASRPLLYPHNMKGKFSMWSTFLRSMDDGLEEALERLHCWRTPFEIKVIDLLMCSPQFNAQLALKRWVDGESKYDVYAYFRTSTLRPIGQVPDVFNTVLTIEAKKRLLTKYLRDTCQHNNMNHLSSYVHDIRLLESQVTYPFMGASAMSIILDKLQECYEMTEAPYAKFMTSCRLNETDGRQYEEQYVRCTDENLAILNLQCVSVVPQQELRNLPLAVPYLRGARRGSDLYATSDVARINLDTSGFFPSTEDHNPQRSQLIGSDEKPKFQLIIHYRELYLATPSEIVINIGYDEEHCHLTFHNLTGELL